MSGGIILRPRQQVFVDRCVAALREHRNTLGVAPTGSGKTIVLSAVAGLYGGRALILQHRDELVRQNRATFHQVNPDLESGVWTAATKRWGRDATFAMVPTLCRPRSLERLPRFDLVVCDETHHIMADTWQRVLARARELNPEVAVLGVTATPNRGDGKGLGGVFTNVCDQITLGELIRAGHLVKPVAHVVDITEGAVGGVRKTRVGEYDMNAVAELLDRSPVTDAIISHWRELAGDRQSVAFAATVEHACHVADMFRGAGVRTLVVTGETPKDERKRELAAFDRGDYQLLVNVAIAVEGWDCPPVSCVMLLRPSSFQSTMIQMIGRGLRTVDPRRYPGVVKRDCVVLDFGASLLTHGGIEQVVDLVGRVPGEGVEGGGAAPQKFCPGCKAMVPLGCRTCPLCGHVWAVDARECETVEEFRLIELDLLIDESPFRWWSFGDRVRVATAFQVWAVAFADLAGTWHAFGGDQREGREVAHLAAGDAVQCLAAGDDWMRARGDRRAAQKNAEWMQRPVSAKQAAMLARMNNALAYVAGLNRYEAGCLITLKFNKRHIAQMLPQHKEARAA